MIRPLAFLAAFAIAMPIGAQAPSVDTYLRPFHLAAALDYVASHAYRKEPSFQRYLQWRVERIRGRGDKVDLWN